MNGSAHGKTTILPNTKKAGFDQSFETFTLEVHLFIQNSLGGMISSPVYVEVVVEYCRR